MLHKLENAKIDELSLVFKTDPATGAEYTPMNQMARVLAVKSGAKKSFLGLDKLVGVVKSYFATDSEPYQWPVSEAPDGIDGDGDGAADYNAVFSAIAQVYNDISSCYWIDNDEARSNAIVTCIDGFLSELDKFRGITKAAPVTPVETPEAPIAPAVAASADPTDKAAPAAGEVLAPELLGTIKVDTEAMQGVVTQIGTMLDTFKSEITTQLEQHATAADAKITERIDAVLAPVTEDLATATATASKLSATVKSLETAAARKPTAPGALENFNGETFQSHSFVTLDKAGAEKTITIPEGTDVSTAMKMLLHPENFQ